MALRFALTLAVAAGALLVAPHADAQDVKYEKYKLPNGMTVILHEDHTLPVGAINTWYRVGAKDELPGRSGFAHLFEHLMFMGTKRVPGNDFDIIMETSGGANNASTSLDRTNYYSAGPASLIPTLLWLDADRLEDFGHTMTQDKLNKQRDVVRNEIRQQVENRPYGKAEEYMFRLMYPPGHPYHWNVYGTHEDLEAADVNNVTDFFATYYVPSNAALVVAGDFDSAKIKPLIGDLFGNIPRGAEVQHRSAPPVKLDHVIRTVTIDKVQLPKVMFVYHSPAEFADGDAEMGLAGAVLSSGKTSRLYKRLVFDDKIAVEVSASQEAAGLGSLFVIDVIANPDADLDVIEKTVDEEVNRMLSGGIKPEELEQRKATFELAKLSQLQSVENKADALNQYEYVWGEPNSFKRDLDRYRNATAQSVQKWATDVLTPKARLIWRVLPDTPQPVASARDKRPQDYPPAPFAVPAAESFKLSNGVPVMLWRRDELPLVGVRMLLKPSGEGGSGGPIDEPARAGLTQLTSQMIGEGTRSLDSLAFGDAMQSLGASFGAFADTESVGVSLTVLKRNFEKAAALMGEAIQSPRMDQSDWDRVKRLHLEELKQQDDEPTVVAARVGARMLFGDVNPYGTPLSGTKKTVEKLTLDDIKAGHAGLFRPDSATIFVAGNITADEAKRALEKCLGSWKAAGSVSHVASNLSVPTAADGLRVYLVDRPDAVQTVVRYYTPGIRFADPNRTKYTLINTILGGSFTSRLNQNLRELHNYTYGARSRVPMQPSLGWFWAGANVKTNTTGESLKEFMKEFERLRAGDISAAETTKAVETVRTDVVQSFQGLGGLLGMAAEYAENGMELNALTKEVSAMQVTTAGDLNALTRGMVPLERGVLVLVGDKKVILEQIKDLNLPKPVEVDVNGDAVSAK